MQAAPLVALDLPLKVLVWADGDQTKVSYTAPAALAARYGLSDELAARLGRDRSDHGRRRQSALRVIAHAWCIRTASIESESWGSLASDVVRLESPLTTTTGS